jgi:hypothetical protein
VVALRALMSRPLQIGPTSAPPRKPRPAPANCPPFERAVIETMTHTLWVTFRILEKSDDESSNHRKVAYAEDKR